MSVPRLGILLLAAAAGPFSGWVFQSAHAATLTLSASSETIHAGMPFTLTLTAKGFEEEPVPAAPELAIEGCEVAFLGVSPSVSSTLQIVNGRRSEWQEVTFDYRWQVLAAAAGRYQVPALRLEQHGVHASARRATFTVTAVPASTDMVVRMRLPERAVWVGETFDAAVEWLLSRDVDSYEFSVPLFNLAGAQVEAQAAAGRTVAFTAGARKIDLPLERAQVDADGRRYTRFSFPARVTLHRAGTVDLAPLRVVARMQTGTGRDSFGFRRPRYQLFRAEGEQRRLVVRPLPLAGRPAIFVNAIGSGFAIDVRASRTVVSAGDPIELTVRLRGDGPLTGLSLPPLSGPEGLPLAHFGVPEGSVAGEVDEETNTKLFRVTVRVKSVEVQEIPPIAFSYFDPAAGEYRTVKSQPVALAVDAAQLVGAADVVAAPAAAPPRRTIDEPRTNAGSIATLLGADMSLSEPEQTFARPWGSGDIRGLLGALYGVPLLAVLASFWLSRTGGRRVRSREIRHALKEVAHALDNGAPAREAAPLIAAAMRRLAQATGADASTSVAVLERLETRAFDPAAARQAVAGDIVDELRGIARDWSKNASRSPIPAAATVSLAAMLLAAPWIWAAEPTGIDSARVLYQSALEETDRLRRVRLFASAERTLRSLATANSATPALQVDWGNAALGAQDAGRAVLAYRRALRSDPGNERARANLAWLRGRLPSWLPRPAAAGALDSLLFWRARFTAAQLHLAGAGAFAIAVLLLAPGPNIGYVCCAPSLFQRWWCGQRPPPLRCSPVLARTPPSCSWTGPPCARQTARGPRRPSPTRCRPEPRWPSSNPATDGCA